MRGVWVTSRNVPLHLSVLEAGGSAPAVVFVHGMCAHAAAFAGAIPGGDFLAALRDEGLNVVAPDLQGHGRSEGRRGHLPFMRALENVGEAVGWAADRFGGPVGLAGSALGGILALYAGLEDDRVGAVACHNAADLRDASALVTDLRKRVLAGFAGTGRLLAQRLPLLKVPVTPFLPLSRLFEDPENVARWRRIPRMTWWYTLESIVSIFFTPEDKPALEAMTKPVLVATGEEDPIFPAAAQRDLVRRLGGPAEVFVLPGAGHMLPLEHRGPTAQRMGEWLRKAL